MSNVSRSPTDLVKGIGTYRETEPFIEFWIVVWQDSGLFWVFAPLCLWATVGCTSAVALFYQKVWWISRFAGSGTAEDSGYNLHSLPVTLNPSGLWFFALVASSINIPYYYSMSTLWANKNTAFGNIQVYILQICASTATAIFLLIAAFKSSVNLIECMNYRDSAHKAPEPPELVRSKKHPSHKQIEGNRRLWKENSSSAELVADLNLSGPVFGSSAHHVRIFCNTATKRETFVVGMFSAVCAVSLVLSDLSIMDLSSFIKIELVVATNFELVWKDHISSLGQSQHCYGYMNSYENVLQSLSFRDLISICGLLIAFGWMSSAVNVFIEFSGCSDLPSRLVNDVGGASFTTALVVLTMIFVRLAFGLLWIASNIAVFWGYMLTDSSNPFSNLPHMHCLPVIGLSVHILSVLVILVLCSYLIWKEKKLNDQITFASALRYSRLMHVNLKASNLWRIPEFVTQPRVILCITEIDLSYNSILFLTNSVLLKFGHIRFLNLSSNSIHIIPSSISAMKSMHSLDLSNNNLRSLPLSLRECILLTNLKLGGNKFSEFPAVLLKMNLIELEIGHNYLKSLPLEIRALENLSTFICCNNMLDALPSTFPELRKIKVLDIRYNVIGSFSLELFRLPCITVLTLWGNPCPYVQNIESGIVEGLPEEWRVALPQLLAAGNPPKKTTQAKSVKNSSTHPISQAESVEITAKFSAADAIGCIQPHSEVPVNVLADTKDGNDARVME